MISYVTSSLPNLSNNLLRGYVFHRHKRLVSSLDMTFCILFTVYGISKPSEFQPLSTSASSISVINLSNMSASDSHSIVFSNSCSMISGFGKSLGGMASDINWSNHCRYTVMDMIGAHASAGLA